MAEPSDAGEDGVGRLGPDEGLGLGVGLVDVVLDGGLEIGGAGEHTALEAAAANAEANGVSVALERMNLRERLPELAPTVVANMTAPILRAVAGLMDAPPDLLVCSGLLPAEQDEVVAAFASVGLAEAERRQDGDWAALLLRRR